MKIVADENMPLVCELFSPYGEVETLPGRLMTASQLKDADVLLVRSVTEVNESLLKGTQVRFVGTATIGTDHIDEHWLQEQGISFASAPGCNAEGVVQYVLSALCVLLPDWQYKTVGIVGCGNVGGRLYRKLKAIGVSCRCYDPFLDREYLDRSQIADLTDFEAVLNCDVICLHTPLTTTGPYPTRHLFDEATLRKLKPGALLLNAGRGGVVDNMALLKVMDDLPLQVVLDVWEGEPSVNLELLQRVDLATPHIAGYSYDGKVRGTSMIRDAFCVWAGAELVKQKLEVELSGELNVIEAADLSDAILGSYNIREDDKRMRKHILAPGADVATEFDGLRKSYPRRLEFQHFQVEGMENGLSFLADKLGFKPTN